MAKSKDVDQYDYRYAVILACSHSSKAMSKLAKLVDSTDERIALMASVAILDRAYGKPVQAIQHSGQINHGHASQYSDADLESIAAGGSAGAAEPATRAH